MMKFKTQFDPPEKVKLYCSPASNVQQHFKDDCDINLLVERFTKTGSFGNERDPSFYSFGDYSGADFREALDIVLSAEEQFQTLPAKVRARFQNNPASLLDFLSDSGNREEAEILGLISKSSPVISTAVPPVEQE